jgi:hypothetical protein
MVEMNLDTVKMVHQLPKLEVLKELHQDLKAII